MERKLYFYSYKSRDFRAWLSLKWVSIISLILLQLLYAQLHAQTKIIKGAVSDVRDPLPNVSVAIEGNASVTTTNNIIIAKEV